MKPMIFLIPRRTTFSKKGREFDFKHSSTLILKNFMGFNEAAS